METKNNYFALSLAVCVLAVQLTTFIFPLTAMFAPPKQVPDMFLPEHATRIMPKADLFLFLFFIAACALLYSVAMVTFKDRMKNPAWWKVAAPYITTEAVLTFMVLAAAFKMTIYDNSPFLAQKALAVLAVVALLLKLFWAEICRILGKVDAWVQTFVPSVAQRKAIDAACIVLIFTIIFIPDFDRVAAQFFIGEQFHHFDFFLMSPGWAYLNGGLPYIDVISQYGVGVVVILSKLSALFGGFDYVPVFKMIMTLGMIYYALMYAFMRYWLGSIPLALGAVIVAFRLQMFHYGVSPLAWTYPSTTPVRFGLDIVWLWLLLAFLRRPRPALLLIAAAYSGFALYYMTSTGMCVMLTFYAFLAALVLIPHVRARYFPSNNLTGGVSLDAQEMRLPSVKNMLLIAASAVLPILTAFILFWCTYGSRVFGGTVWHNMSEYLTFFAHGHAGGVLPIYESLKYRNYWASAMGFAFPLAFTFTVGMSAIGVAFKKIRTEHIFIGTVAVYGLINYQYYVVRSAVTSYYINAVPFVLVGAFWLVLALKRIEASGKSAAVKSYAMSSWQSGPARRRRLTAAALALSFYALLTNHNYISYPNMFNFSRNPMVDITVAQRYPDRQGYFNHLVKPMKEEDKLPVNSTGQTDEDIRTEDSFKNDEELKAYFRQEFNFPEDAALISSLTPPGERAPVLSSFETKLLIQARRAPFFYHTPVLTSQPMRMRAYPADAAHSPNFLADTVRQLEGKQPPYIFMERIFLQDKIPASYAKSNANITALAAYVRAHYEPVGTGKYLVAMKRK